MPEIEIWCGETCNRIYVDPTRRYNYKFEIVPCPKCGAKADEVCRTSGGNTQSFPHVARIELAKAEHKRRIDAELKSSISNL